MIAIEPWKTKRMIVAVENGLTRAGVYTRTVRTFETAWRKWAKGAVIARED